MTLRPILFSTPMVQAILAGRKTITRRTRDLEILNDVADQPGKKDEDDPGRWFICEFINGIQYIEDLDSLESIKIKCPYGQPGDVLWVRETYAEPHLHDGFEDDYYYRADCSDFARKKYVSKWKPSIHMPRSASRLFLRITSVRVERLHEINVQDAKREGILSWTEGTEVRYKNYMVNTEGYGHPEHDCPSLPFAIDSFLSLWESINGEESRNANPWVWVIEFKRISSEEFRNL